MAERRAAEFLRRGAAMLSEHCPACGYPLLKLEEEVWCPSCNRKVVLVKEGEEIAERAGPAVLGSIEEVLLVKVQEVAQRIKTEGDPSTLNALSSTLYMLLKSLASLKQIREK